MHISDEGLVAGSVNRAELVAAYAAATDKAVKANLAVCGVENGMYVEGDKLIDPSVPPEPEPEPEPEPSAEDDVDALRAQAEALGVKVDKRWGTDRLRDEIATAEAEADESEE